MKNPLTLLASMMLAAGSLTATAASLDITAFYAPSATNPENNSFTITTPEAGFCKSWPIYCTGDAKSVDIKNLTLKGNGILRASDSTPKNNFFLSLPKNTPVTLVNSTSGQTIQAKFEITHFHAAWTQLTGGGVKGWENGSFVYPSKNTTCYSANGSSSVGSGDGSSNTTYRWGWTVSGGNCFKLNTLASRDISSSKLKDIIIRYKLITVSPLLLEPGEYTGYVDWSIGPDGNISFGNKWDASDSMLRVNFSLNVNHELKLTTTAEDQQVSLQPCASGKVCSADEGAANWERWMITRITPELSGRSRFNLTSSGAFTVYVQCEHQSGQDCALRSDNTPSQTVPVQSLLTLPQNILDVSTGSTVSKRRLATSKDLNKNIFVSNSYGQNRAGHIDFLVSQKDVDTMLKTRPDTYRGAVTVIIDPKL
ncbi:hypothetical protein [Erwinia sp. SLM-02]|uniref:hypothetical protein n=1 Tax=Erwinia sp. SLM-02 TaxID=3020057 RepID=UPI00307FF8FD